MNKQSRLAMATLMYTLLHSAEFGPSMPRIRKAREHKPWEQIQLSKAERKGKTPEQIMQLREAKYLASIEASHE
jgi:hypothetical protein